MTPHIMTFTGVVFNPLRPVMKDVRIEDIAHALANQTRFTGHCLFRYSVAEHCVRVSELLEARGYSQPIQLWGLLHDSSEAYLIDLPTPLKANGRLGGAYKMIEARLQAVICRRFSLQVVEPASVKRADKELLATEVRDLMSDKDSFYWRKVTALPLPERIRPWGVDVVEHEYLRRYRLLTGDVRGLRKKVEAGT